MENLEAVYEDRIAYVFAGEFTLALLKAAFSNLNIASPLRANNFAYALSEVFRHTLFEWSPDEHVSACDWFKPDPTSSSGITHRHRIKYVIQGGLHDVYVTKQLGLEDVDEKIKGLLETIDLLSGYMHIEPHTIETSDAEVERFAIECLETTLGILEKTIETRHHLHQLVLAKIDLGLVQSSIEDSVMELMRDRIVEQIDHHVNTGIFTINPNSIYLQIAGSVWDGSGRVDTGDGHGMTPACPFWGAAKVFFNEPLGSSTVIDSLDIRLLT